MKFQVDVSWLVMGGTVIEADTEEEARRLADDLPLSAFNADFLADSFAIDNVEETAG